MFLGLTASFPAGLTLVQGDASTGKTTLLRLLAGELVPQGGQIVLAGREGVEGREPGRQGADLRRAAFWRDPRSEALERFTPLDWLTSEAARWPDWDVALLKQHLEGFALAEHLEKPFFALSTGTRRKVLLAAALACGARLVLVDEPVAGLDKASCRYLCDALAVYGRAHRAGCALVLAHFEGLPGVPWGTTLVLPA